MRKAIAASAIVAVLSVGGVTGVAAWSGSAVTDRLAQQARELEKLSPNIKVVKQKVTRGLFRSTHEVTIQFGCLPPDALRALGNTQTAAAGPLQLSWRDVVQHGPLPGAHSVGLATIDSELLVPESYKAQLESLIGEQSPLRVHSAIGFGRDIVSDWTVASVQYAHPEQGSISSKPIVGRAMGKLPESTGAAASWVLDIPSMEVNVRALDGASVLVKVGRLLSQTEVGKRDDPALWLAPVKSSGMISSLELSGSANNASATALPALRVRYDGIKFSSDATLDKGLWSSSSTFTAKGTINDVALDKFEFATSLKRMHATTYQRLLANVFDTVLSCEQPAQPDDLEALFSSLQKQLAELLVHNPEYALDKLAVELFGKRAELSYSIGTQGVSASDAALPMPLLLASKGFARARAQIHMGLIEQVANKVANYDVAKGQPLTPLSQTSPFVNGMVDQFAQLGYLQRDGELIKASASFEGGQTLVNGKPFALSDLALPAP